VGLQVGVQLLDIDRSVLVRIRLALQPFQEIIGEQAVTFFRECGTG
jgi:hypothetical protein